MTAAKGNKYNQHGDEPMDANIHSRITIKLKEEFNNTCKRNVTTMTAELLKFIEDYVKK